MEIMTTPIEITVSYQLIEQVSEDESRTPAAILCPGGHRLGSDPWCPNCAQVAVAVEMLAALARTGR